MKRDLEADLGICSKATLGPWVKDERTGCVAVYPSSIGDVNCMDDSDGKRIFYKNGYVVTDEYGMFWEVSQQDSQDAEFIAQAREGWPHALERALKAEATVRELLTAVEIACRLASDCKTEAQYGVVIKRGRTEREQYEAISDIVRRAEEVLDDGNNQRQGG